MANPDFARLRETLMDSTADEEAVTVNTYVPHSPHALLLFSPYQSFSRLDDDSEGWTMDFAITGLPPLEDP